MFSRTAYQPSPFACPKKFHPELKFDRNPSSRSSISSKLSADIKPEGLQSQPQHDLSRILRTESAIKAIELKANSKRHTNLWPKAVLEALDAATSENRWETALKIFDLLRQQQWYKPKSRSYARLLMMLGKCKKPREASALFETMSYDGLHPTVDVYTALASAYGQSGLLEEAIAIINDMKSTSDCKPDVYTYSILINSCVKNRRFDLTQKLLSEMQYTGVETNLVIHNSVIDGLGKSGMFKELESHITSMSENDSCRPDIFTMNSVLNAYGSRGKIPEMERWYSEFQLMGVVPDVKTFNILIGSYAKRDMFEKLKSVLKYMEKRAFSPSVATFNTMLVMYGRKGDVRKMDECFQRMKESGIKANSITYVTLVRWFGKSGAIERVNSVLRQIENSDVKVEVWVYNCFIHVYGEVGDLESVGRVYLMMLERNCAPNEVTYLSLIRVYSGKGMKEVADDFRAKLLKDGSGLVCK